MTLDTTTIAFGSLFLAVFASLFGAFKYVSSEIASMRKELELKLNEATALQAKARHDSMNHVQANTSRIEADLLRSNEKLQNLSLDAVRKSDMAAFESRITSLLSASDTRMTHAIEKSEATRAAMLSNLEAKIDRIMEKSMAMTQSPNARYVGAVKGTGSD